MAVINNDNHDKAMYKNGYMQALCDMSKTIRDIARENVTNMHERSTIVDIVRAAEKELQI